MLQSPFFSERVIARVGGGVTVIESFLRLELVGEVKSVILRVPAILHLNNNI